MAFVWRLPFVGLSESSHSVHLQAATWDQSTLPLIPSAESKRAILRWSSLCKWISLRIGRCQCPDMSLSLSYSTIQQAIAWVCSVTILSFKSRKSHDGTLTVLSILLCVIKSELGYRSMLTRQQWISHRLTASLTNRISGWKQWKIQGVDRCHILHAVSLAEIILLDLPTG